jgi:hypothetical protein
MEIEDLIDFDCVNLSVKCISGDLKICNADNPTFSPSFFPSPVRSTDGGIA